MFFPVITAAPEPVIETAARLAAEIGSELNRRVGVSKEVSRDLVYLDRHGARPVVGLEALACALDAHLTTSADGYTITRSPAEVTAIRGRVARVRADWISRRLDEIESFRTRSLGSGDPELVTERAIANERRAFKEAMHQQNTGPRPPQASTLLPGQGLLDRLIKRIGPSNLAGAIVGGRGLFEDDPVAGAQHLPEWGDLLAAYDVDMDRLQRSSLEAKAKSDPLLVGDLFAGWGEKVTDPAKLRLSTDAGADGISLTLEGYDPRGKIVLWANLIAGPSSDGQTTDDYAQGATNTSDDSEIPVSSAAHQAASFLPRQGSPMPEWFLRPDTAEPLDTMARDAIAALAGDEAKCFAFDVPDDVWAVIRELDRLKALRISTLKRAIHLGELIESVQTVDYVCWRPLDPEGAAASRADRKSLARYVTERLAQGVDRLRTEARLAHDASTGVARLSYPWSTILDLVTDGPFRQENFGARFLKLVGAISDSDWKALCDGAIRTCGQLGVTAEMQGLLRDDWAQPTVEAMPRAAQAESDGSIPPGAGSNSVPDLFRHAIELFPEGVPDSVPIIVSVDSSPLWQSADPKAIGGSPGWAEGSNVLGTVAAVLDPITRNPRLLTTRDDFDLEMGRFVFRSGHRTVVTVRIRLPRGLAIVGRSFSSPVPDGEFFTYADLPQATRDEIWDQSCGQALDRAKSATIFGIGQGLTPPPTTAGQSAKP